MCTLPLYRCCCSVSQLCPTLFQPHGLAHQASLAFTISQSLLTLMSIELMMSSNHLILCRPLLLLPSIFPSTGVFSSESALRIKWPTYWSFSFSISPSSESSLAPQFEASVLQCSAFFVVQFPHPYMTTGKTTTLTRRTFVYRPLPLYDRWYFFYLFHILRLFLVFHC